MKTTLDLNDELLARAKARAAREQSSLTRLIEDGLRLRLRSQPRPTSSSNPAIAVYRGHGGMRKGLDPRSNRSLLDSADDDT